MSDHSSASAIAPVCQPCEPEVLSIEEAPLDFFKPIDTVAPIESVEVVEPVEPIEVEMSDEYVQLTKDGPLIHLTIKRKRKRFDKEGNFIAYDGYLCRHPSICSKRIQSEGLCIAHGGAQQQCEHPGCTKVRRSQGMCITHGGKHPTCPHGGRSWICQQCLQAKGKSNNLVCSVCYKQLAPSYRLSRGGSGMCAGCEKNTVATALAQE